MTYVDGNGVVWFPSPKPCTVNNHKLFLDPVHCKIWCEYYDPDCKLINTQYIPMTCEEIEGIIDTLSNGRLVSMN